MSEMNKINNEELEKVTGGNDGMPSGGGDWTWGTVHDVVHYDSSSCLTLRDAPDGNVMYYDSGKPIGWQNGDSASVLLGSEQGSWVRARKDGYYGWTNRNYVWY